MRREGIVGWLAGVSLPLKAIAAIIVLVVTVLSQQH